MDTQWFGPAFLVLFVVLVGWAIHAARKRQKALEQVASKLGMRFEKRIESPRFEGLTRLPMFSRGEVRADNVLHCDVGGATCYLFDYTYVRRKRRRKRTHAQGTYSCFKLHERRLPIFQIRHANKGRKADAIVFDSHPEFGNHYVVTGEDEVAVREVVSNELLDYLQRQGDAAWAVEGSGEWLGIALRPTVSLRRHINPEDMRQIRDDVLRIYKGLVVQEVQV